MTTQTNRRMAILAGLTGLALLAGCSRGATEMSQPEAANAMTDPVPSDTPTMNETAPIEAPAETSSTNMTAPAAAAPVAPDAQMLDDADATGMTSRVPRRDAPVTDTPTPAPTTTPDTGQ